MAAFLEHRNDTPTVDNLKLLYNCIIKSKTTLLNIAFLDNSGTQQCIYPKKFSTSNGLNYSFRDYFKEVRKTNETVMSEPLVNFNPKGNILEYEAITFISPVVSLSHKKKLGYLIINVDIASLEELIQYKDKKGDYTSISFYLIDTKSNNILISPSNEKSEKLSIANKDFRSFIINYSNPCKENHSILTKISKEKVYITSTHLKINNYTFAIVAAVPYKHTINYIADFSRMIALIIIFIALMLFLVAAFVIYNEIIVKKLKNKISRLEIIIDEKSKIQDMEDIVQSEYFKNLADKVKSIKD